MMEPVTEEIYQMLIDNMHITYVPDESTERRIKNEASSGIAYIRKYCDPEADFGPGSRFGQMLCDYVLRAEAGARETFAVDFAGEITAAHLEHEVEQYAGVTGYAET
ncbi:MAG TPA: hypothetical protein DCZ20_01925 [Lachnospiraceae bacterium]|nr:hypothetical protein [Lachnospiraceae bacterium]